VINLVGFGLFKVVAGVEVGVLVAGVQTCVQDLAGRTGMWDVGVPPSGAWDDRSFGLANRAVGNPPTAAGLPRLTLVLRRHPRRTALGEPARPRPHHRDAVLGHVCPAQLAARVRALSGGLAPLWVTSAVSDRRYQGLLGIDDPPAAAGWSFTIARRYVRRAQAEAFQAVLDRLQALNVIAWQRYPAEIEVTVASDADRVMAHGP